VTDRPDRRWTDSEDGARIARNVAASLRGVLDDIHRGRFAQARRALSFELMRIEVYAVPARLADPTLEIAKRVQSHLRGKHPMTHAAQIELEALIDFWAKRARLED
jgi:hypothetical protein